MYSFYRKSFCTCSSESARITMDASLWTTQSCAARLPYIRDTNICAGGTLEGSTGVCKGDSGGPLQCYTNGKWYQIGITSWGIPCGNRGYPDVYTKVVQYHQWIQQTIAHE